MYALRERRVHVTQEDFELAVAKVSLTSCSTNNKKKIAKGQLFKASQFQFDKSCVFSYSYGLYSIQ